MKTKNIKIKIESSSDEKMLVLDDGISRQYIIFSDTEWSKLLIKDAPVLAALVLDTKQ